MKKSFAQLKTAFEKLQKKKKEKVKQSLSLNWKERNSLKLDWVSEFPQSPRLRELVVALGPNQIWFAKGIKSNSIGQYIVTGENPSWKIYNKYHVVITNAEWRYKKWGEFTAAGEVKDDSQAFVADEDGPFKLLDFGLKLDWQFKQEIYEGDPSREWKIGEYAVFVHAYEQGTGVVCQVFLSKYIKDGWVGEFKMLKRFPSDNLEQAIEFAKEYANNHKNVYYFENKNVTLLRKKADLAVNEQGKLTDPLMLTKLELTKFIQDRFIEFQENFPQATEGDFLEKAEYFKELSEVYKAIISADDMDELSAIFKDVFPEGPTAYDAIYDKKYPNPRLNWNFPTKKEFIGEMPWTHLIEGDWVVFASLNTYNNNYEVVKAQKAVSPVYWERDELLNTFNTPQEAVNYAKEYALNNENVYYFEPISVTNTLRGLKLDWQMHHIIDINELQKEIRKNPDFEYIGALKLRVANDNLFYMVARIYNIQDNDRLSASVEVLDRFDNLEEAVEKGQAVAKERNLPFYIYKPLLLDWQNLDEPEYLKIDTFKPTEDDVSKGIVYILEKVGKNLWDVYDALLIYDDTVEEAYPIAVSTVMELTNLSFENAQRLGRQYAYNINCAYVISDNEQREMGKNQSLKLDWQTQIQPGDKVKIKEDIYVTNFQKDFGYNSLNLKGKDFIVDKVSEEDNKIEMHSDNIILSQNLDNEGKTFEKLAWQNVPETKIYKGSNISGYSIVTVDGKRLPLYLEYVNHSPDGFNWGYAGSGPAQLAFAILFDYSNNASWARMYYRDFKFNIISNIQTAIWELSSLDIEQWIKTRGIPEPPKNSKDKLLWNIQPATYSCILRGTEGKAIGKRSDLTFDELLDLVNNGSSAEQLNQEDYYSVHSADRDYFNNDDEDSPKYQNIYASYILEGTEYSYWQNLTPMEEDLMKKYITNPIRNRLVSE
jgi:hypothetical protein